MFENRADQFTGMVNNNEEFRQLYKQHKALDKRVRAADNRTAPMDTLALNKLKKEKLWLKDRMDWLMERH